MEGASSAEAGVTSSTRAGSHVSSPACTGPERRAARGWTQRAGEAMRCRGRGALGARNPQTPVARLGETGLCALRLHYRPWREKPDSGSGPGTLRS